VPVGGDPAAAAAMVHDEKSRVGGGGGGGYEMARLPHPLAQQTTPPTEIRFGRSRTLELGHGACGSERESLKGAPPPPGTLSSESFGQTGEAPTRRIWIAAVLRTISTHNVRCRWPQYLPRPVRRWFSVGVDWSTILYQ